MRIFLVLAVIFSIVVWGDAKAASEVDVLSELDGIIAELIAARNEPIADDDDVSIKKIREVCSKLKAGATEIISRIESIEHELTLRQQRFDNRPAEYYKLLPDVLAAASRRGDELFAQLVTNLPESSIVNAAESAVMQIYGSCSLRQYTVQGTILFSGKLRSGYPMHSYGMDSIQRKVMRGTPVAALFDKECSK